MSTLVQLVVERVVNSLPEGLLIALAAWLLLRLLRRQNSGTRFGVWMVALMGVLLLPLLGHPGSEAVMSRVQPEIAVPEFWAVGFFAVWAAGALIGVARVVLGVLQVRRMRRQSVEILPQTLPGRVRQRIAEAGRSVQLRASENVRIPAAIGFRHPAIVLPAWVLREMKAEDLEPILIHELAHLQRGDDWTNLLQKLARAVFFFHPAVWWIDARLSLEREMACDDAVLVATGNPRAYAGCLIDLLEKSCTRRGWTMAQAAVARTRDASVRIARILHIGTPATTRMARPVVGVAATLALGCAGVVFCTPQLLVFSPEAAPAMQARNAGALVRQTAAPAISVPVVFHPRRDDSPVRRMPADLVAPAQKMPRTAAARVVMAGLTVPVEKREQGFHEAKAVLHEASPVRRTAARPMVIVVAAYVPEGAAPARVSASVSAVQVQTLQWIEENGDELTVQMTRVVLVVPAQNLMQAGVSAQSI